MKKLVFFFLLFFSVSFGYSKNAPQNPCASDEVKENVLAYVIVYDWLVDNPLVASFELLTLALFSPDKEKLEEWAYEKFKERIDNINIVEISKPEKSGKKSYRCSAVVELNGKKYVVVYTVKKVHSGKKDYYSTKAEEIFKVE